MIVVVAGGAGRVGGGQLGHLGLGRDPAVGHDRLQRLLPALVVAVRAVGVGLPPLHCGDEMVAEVVPAEAALLHQGRGHGEGPALPGLVEHHLAVEPGRAGRVVGLEERHRQPGEGAGTFATPTMASRVTRSASSSSEKASAPAGRWGSTR